jgi:hypothetical protein
MEPQKQWLKRSWHDGSRLKAGETEAGVALTIVQRSPRSVDFGTGLTVARIPSGAVAAARPQLR